MPQRVKSGSLSSHLVRPTVRFIARLEDRVHSFWRQTPAHRRASRVVGIVLFGCMSIALMGNDGCSCTETGAIQSNPLAAANAILKSAILGSAGVHFHTSAHPNLVGSDGSQTATAAFVGNATVITEPASTYFVVLRNADCSLALITGTSSLTGNFALTSATTNYERTLHQLAGLTTTPDVFAGGCAEKTVGVSSRAGAYAGVTKNGIAVAATAAGNGNSNALFVLTTPADLSAVQFAPITSLTSASAVATADLNVDGNGDFVVVNSYNATSAFVSVVLGNADGTFQTPVSYPTAGTKSIAAVIEDVNGDGNLDLVVASDDQKISVLTGKGDGTFNAAQSFSAPLAGSATPTSTPIHGLITADINGDGKKDIVCSNGVVLLGNGDGTFTQLSTPAFPYIGSANSPDGPSLAAGDINRDGKKDLVVNDGKTITAWLGKGDGTFTRGSSYSSIGNSGYVTLSDLDGDGNLDIYTGLAGGGLYSGDDASFAAASVLMGHGDGTFVGAPTTPAGAYTGTNLADVNGDGIPDLVSAATSSANTPLATFTVQLGTGQGTFTSASTIPSPANFTLNGYNFTGVSVASATLSGYALADINGDGKADLVFVSTGLSASPGSGFAITYPYPVYFTALSNGDGTFQTPVPHPFPQIAAASGFDNTLTVSGLHIADFNKDGKADLLFAYNDLAGGAGVNPYQQGFVILTGNGDATFSTTPILTSDYSSTTAPTTTSPPTVLATADLNGDGNPALLVHNTTFTVATGTVSQLQVYLGNGDGTFKTPTALVSANQYGIPVIADLNNDGKLDLAFLSETPSSQAQLNLALGNGDGTFTLLPTVNLTGGDTIRSSSLAAADFNGDGNIDLALLAGNSFSGIFYGKGTGAFSSVPNGSTIYPKDLINLYVSGAATAVDLNKDGKPDLLVGNTVLLNSYGVAVVPVLTATTTAVSASPNPAALGATVTLTATVTPASGTTVPTGTVTFLDGTTTLGTGTVNASNQATLTTSALTTGTHSITATYAGDTNFSTSTSAAVSLTITAPVVITTSTSLSASANSIATGTSVTFTATVTAASGTVIPTGPVTFTDGTAALAVLSLDSTGKATYTTTSLSLGTHTITASYAGTTTGNPTFAASVSSALTETVSAPAPSDFTLALSQTSSTVTHGSPATTVVTVTPTGGFSSAVALSCTRAPANSSCTVSPSSVTPTTAPVTATVTFQTSITAAALHSDPLNRERSGSLLAIVGILPFSFLGMLAFNRRVDSARNTDHDKHSRIPLNLLSLVCLAALIAATGCSGKSSSSSTQTTAPGTYTLTITATAGTTTHSTPYSVTVQ